MTFDMYAASAPIFVNTLTNMRAWLDKAEAAGSETNLIEAQLAPDMRPLSAQYQMASDAAKGAVARLSGVEAPAMADDETTIEALRERCDRTIAFINGVDVSAFDGSADREIVLKFPNGMGYRFDGSRFLTGFALPNFFFHATTAYAILRASGVPLGKIDFLQHLGAPNLAAE